MNMGFGKARIDHFHLLTFYLSIYLYAYYYDEAD